MLNKINISPQKQKIILYIVLTVVTLAVFWQVYKFGFITFDDPVYVTDNSHIQSGITLDGVLWAFSTTYAEFWHPLTWLSLMLDYQLYGLNAGGYHVTNLILHILSTLLLFWFFNRMTGAVWKSAFVAALFALHPLHVETVVWITKRKDVLSALFWMLTLCLYVYYTEKPVIRRYLLVLFSFVCGLMSKPMVVTLPVIMILLDYWPLKRFELKKENLFLWQLKEKIPLFILSAVFSIITIYAQNKPSVINIQSTLDSRLANAPVAFISYLGKTFWPHDLAVFYPFSDQLPFWQIFGSAMLILVISIAVIVAMKRLPYLFVGWLWYAIAVVPVLNIFRASQRAMSDNYNYLPSIGIAIILAWSIPLLFPNEDMRKKILLPAGLAVLAILAILSWHQCGYWKTSMELFNHALQVTKNNYLALNQRGNIYSEKGQYQLAIKDYDEAIRLKQNYAFAYNNRGNTYLKLGQYQQAIKDYSQAILMKPDYANAYYNRGFAYGNLGQYQLAVNDLNEAIRMEPNYSDTYLTRGTIYFKQDEKQLGCLDFKKACELGNCKLYEETREKGDCNVMAMQQNNDDYYNKKGNYYLKLGQYQMAIEYFSNAIRLKKDYADAYHNRGTAYGELGRYQLALDDYNESIRLKPNYADSYHNRGIIYLLQGKKELGCRNFQKACSLGNCKLLELAKSRGDCR